MAVVQAGSMGKAARNLNTSQPNISKSIADLEHALGVRLLDRHRQGIDQLNSAARCSMVGPLYSMNCAKQ